MKKYLVLIVIGVQSVLFTGCKQNGKNTSVKLETIKLNNGVTKVIGATINGKKQGMWILYDDSGRITSNRTYVNDSLLGEEIDYWENGKISSRRYLKGEEIEGEWVQYYDFDKNKLAQKGSYRAGNKIGIWEYYIEDGRLNKKVNYTDTGEVILVNNHLIPETLIK